jgi:hypothetical protein
MINPVADLARIWHQSSTSRRLSCSSSGSVRDEGSLRVSCMLELGQSLVDRLPPVVTKADADRCATSTTSVWEVASFPSLCKVSSAGSLTRLL